MPIINVNNINLYYELHGQGQPIIFIAGIKADHTNWLNILEQFAQHYQVIILDNRSTGQTDNFVTTFTIETMADDIYALIKHLNLQHPHIIGHSMGGAVAQALAAKYPTAINKLVLCNTFKKINTLATIVLDNILDLHKANFAPEIILKHILPWGLSNSFLQTPDMLPTILAGAAQNPFPQKLIGYQSQFEALKKFDSTAYLNKIVNPTLVIGSEEDILTPMYQSIELADGIKNAELIKLPGGHASSVEQADLFVKSIMSFL